MNGDILTAAEADRLAEDANVRLRSYSGRGMYGEQCLGIVGSAADFGRAMIALAEIAGPEDAAWVADRVRTDSMGLETIYYFPGVSVEIDDEGDEEGDE